MPTNSDQLRQPEPIDRRLFLNLGGMLLFFVLGSFLPAGTWMWTKGWLFILVIVVASILGMLYLRRVNPEVIAARINRHKGSELWDRLLGAIFLLIVTVIPIVAALDDGRFHWSHVPWWAAYWAIPC